MLDEIIKEINDNIASYSGCASVDNFKVLKDSIQKAIFQIEEEAYKRGRQEVFKEIERNYEKITKLCQDVIDYENIKIKYLSEKQEVYNPFIISKIKTIESIIYSTELKQMFLKSPNL
jgi:hypothetical protein